MFYASKKAFVATLNQPSSADAMEQRSHEDPEQTSPAGRAATVCVSSLRFFPVQFFVLLRAVLGLAGKREGDGALHPERTGGSAQKQLVRRVVGFLCFFEAQRV